jgi:4-amino-4-deoxy-L-arabinose transferase-like glycosyltransferase
VSRPPAWALVAAAVALQAGLSIHALSGSSATFDEGAHLPAGYSYLALGDHRLNPEQPPLVKLLAAAPLLPLAPELRTSDVSWREARQWEFGRRFLYRWNDADRLLFRGRLPVVALASLLVLAVFVAGRARFGAGAGLAAAGLAALSPDVLAHGSLVTTDLAFALFFFLAVAGFERFAARPAALGLLAAGLAAGLALATKFSAVLLPPVLLALAVAAALSRRARPIPLAAGLAGALLFGLAVLWASYGFERALSGEPELREKLRAPLVARYDEPARAAVAWAGRAGLVPEDYARGLLFVTEHSAARPTFLLGERRDGPFPHYFAVSFLVKTPVPLLLLLAVALVRLPRLDRADALFVWLPVAIYVAASATRGLQIGHRHLLPVYPFLFLAAGEAAAALAAWRAPRGAVAASALALWYAAGTLVHHPHHLAYFNELAGGPRNGWRVLVDSNLDWGQDLKRLAGWLREHPAPGLKLSYFGSADPAYYGIESEALPG